MLLLLIFHSFAINPGWNGCHLESKHVVKEITANHVAKKTRKTRFIVVQEYKILTAGEHKSVTGKNITNIICYYKTIQTIRVEEHTYDAQGSYSHSLTMDVIAES